ncbi:hypothetical protein SAMD00023353_11200210 [Rosellinia necatrix]|uniref:Uncharacterized protein n=1 Tax=Rosellinia necatrix TaxID=77044 RepID=A0A1W2TX88_ROSNE|nr:hypothetical protein SAMD00023353_11200210 [Rosellinia necatrix]
MTHLTKSSLFHKKSKGSFCKPHSPEEQTHVRKWSSSSTISHASEDDSHRRRPDRFNPLSLHPPLSFNTSPHMPQYDIARYQEDEERESRFFDQTRYADDHIQDMTEYSPIKGKNCYFDGSTARPYQYDQDSQWPLKDWQTIPPGLSEPSSSNSSSLASSPTQPDVPRRRNADWMDDTDVFIKRGAWKRQGIVFHLSEQDEQFQHQHFELPE